MVTRFVDGPYMDEIPELADNILTKESAAFVDVIHTNGGFEPCVVCTTCKVSKYLFSHLFYPGISSVGNHSPAWSHGLLP